MKKYKVGDTIYLKGTIVDSDCAQQYLIKPGDYTYGFWFKRDAIADLPEPVKPVLPQKVADELIEAKAFGYNFLGYMNVALDNDYPSTNMFSFDSDDVHINKKIKTLSDAWYNGYTVEKEPTWYIEVPGKFVRPTYYAIHDGSLAFGYLDEDKKGYRDYSAHAFTNEEIKKYDLENFEKELVTDDNED